MNLKRETSRVPKSEASDTEDDRRLNDREMDHRNNNHDRGLGDTLEGRTDAAGRGN